MWRDCWSGFQTAPCWVTRAAPCIQNHSSVLPAGPRLLTPGPLDQATAHGFLAAPEAGA